MDITNILAVSAIAINWAVFLVGMPHQVYMLFKQKHAEGLSVATFSLYLIAFSFGLAYGIDISNRPLIWGNIPAVFFSAIISSQIIYYKYKKRTP